ncbi:organic hydroperoxide resistance protein [Kangiella geojedonensis]|uniref:OsmC-like organic hydroperoxide reductase n=1 Tax=Kangiella geojedonensis TaxID=914150 RepID=A0A0F6TQN2_9GAMM|nr:organic hydroperoxide resistance protein [Kangiella geojedonensis]AKE52115.1 OsmC-like organic hydroperoxide reductase [Kangiella geojedonensis]
MKKPNEIAYKTKATATGGRSGTAKSEDGKLEVTLSTPKELGGAGGNGTNPEQLFAAGYSACFIGAMQHVAGQEKVKLPEDTTVTGEVGIGPTDGGFAIDVELQVSIPGMDKSEAESLVEKAHQVCPYSNATRGGVDVRLKVV